MSLVEDWVRSETRRQFLSRGKNALTVHHGLYQDETAALCQWHVPEAHFLESWSDARAYNGTASIVQPLIAPLFGGKSAHELLEVFTEGMQRSAYDIVRAYWTAHRPASAYRFLVGRALGQIHVPEFRACRGDRV